MNDSPGEQLQRSNQPMDIGSELAQARERQGLSLTELSRRTKLSVATLRAIENGAMKSLPGGIFTRGALRAYAREVGCDQEETVRRYCDRFEPHDGPEMGTANPPTDPLTRICAAGQVHVAEIDAMERRRLRFAWIAGSAVILLGGALYFEFLQGASDRATIRRPAATTAALPLLPVPASVTVSEVGTTGSLNAERPIDRDRSDAGHALRVDVQPSGVCWFSAAADGREPIARLVDVGQTTQISADEHVVLRIGDAAHCKLQVNGVAARRLGGAGQPVTLRITRKNYREFLEP